MPPSMMTSILIIAAISLTIGYIAGWLISSLRGDKQSSNPSSKKGIPDEPTANQRLILRVWRDVDDGSLAYELYKKKLAGADSLSLEERQQLVELLKETGRWMGLPVEKPAQNAGGVETGEMQRSAGMAPAAEPETSRPSILGGMTNVLADAVNPQQSAKRDAPKSIVQQIDEIFQEKLIGSPYEGQKIFLSEDPRKGVIVWIGNTAYEGIGSVPEGEIKNLLKASVQEWEHQQESQRRNRGG